jgi:hypothetical protein
MESSNVELTSVYVEMGLGISLARVVMDLPALKRRLLDFMAAPSSQIQSSKRNAY